MATSTYIALATTTLTGNDAEIVFSSIPATYRDLVVVAYNKNATGIAGCRIRLNGDTGNNYSYVSMDGSGAGATSGSQTDSSLNIAVSTNEFGTSLFHIMDYSATDKHKTVLARGNALPDNVRAGAGRWANTDAVTSVTITTAAYDFVSGSTFSLYGIIS